MRFSVVALAGLVTFGNNLGAYARAIPNDLALSSSQLAARNVEIYADDQVKRGVAILPRVPIDPVVPKPVTPEPVNPEPKTPEPITPEPEPVTPEPVTPEPEPVTPEPVSPEPVTPEPGTTNPESDLGTKPEGVKGITNPAAASREGSDVKEDPNAVEDGNACGIVAARDLDALEARSLAARADAERVPDDAANYRKVYEWLVKSGVDKTKLVFYTGDAGQAMAAAFVAEEDNEDEGYEYFWSIFNDEFSEAFGGVNMDDSEVTKACSKALALFAKNPLVFNHDNASQSSYWLTIEYPAMWRAGTITKLKDNALTPEETDGTIALPAKPGSGSAASC